MALAAHAIACRGLGLPWHCLGITCRGLGCPWHCLGIACHGIPWHSLPHKQHVKPAACCWHAWQHAMVPTVCTPRAQNMYFGPPSKLARAIFDFSVPKFILTPQKDFQVLKPLCHKNSIFYDFPYFSASKNKIKFSKIPKIAKNKIKFFMPQT